MAVEVEVDAVDRSSDEAQACLRAYYAELNERFDAGFDVHVALPADMDPLLVARIGGEAIGCGGLVWHGNVPDIKRMWVARSARGLGVAKRLLAELEARALAGGAERVRLETNASLVEPSPCTGRTATSRSSPSTTSPTPTTGSRSDCQGEADRGEAGRGTRQRPLTSDPVTEPDLAAAAAAIDAAQSVVDRCAAHIAANGGIDANQQVAYDLAHAASAVDCGRTMLDYGAKGDLEARMTCAFVADAIADLAAKMIGRGKQWGVDPSELSSAADFVADFRDPEYLAALAGEEGPRHLDSDFEMVQDTFRRFAEEKVRPVAEHIHRTNGDIPEDLIRGLAEIGTFGLSVPEEYDGFAAGGESDYMAMVVATEELSRGSLGAAGSLITRPEILTRALVGGGTEEQKKEWLPKLASAEVMAAVAVTEPDYGSEAANVKVSATRDGDEWVINGVKTWCTFAGRADALMLLARTDPDRSLRHKGLSLFIVPKEQVAGHSFELAQDGGGKMEGRAIDTIGYRGMHSFEVSFDGWRVPHANLIGGDEGVNRGYYMTMGGFENGRIQTAARAIGVMQAAYEAGRDYSRDRVVFGQPIFDFQLTKVKLARMAFLIQGARQYAYAVAKEMANGRGALEASMCKAYVCKAAEWVAREAMQLHGGMGYAEEFPVSRYFVDARVLSIFEGADETLCLQLIARRLLERAAS